jgi:ubiquinone/menaquinone biosynthesis C-methylase UbiE
MVSITLCENTPIGNLHDTFWVIVAMDWASLPQGAKVVDVGGGIGMSSLTLARTFSNLNMIVQDSVEVTEQGRKVSKQIPAVLRLQLITLSQRTVLGK